MKLTNRLTISALLKFIDANTGKYFARNRIIGALEQLVEQEELRTVNPQAMRMETTSAEKLWEILGNEVLQRPNRITAFRDWETTGATVRLFEEGSGMLKSAYKRSIGYRFEEKDVPVKKAIGRSKKTHTVDKKSAKRKHDPQADDDEIEEGSSPPKKARTKGPAQSLKKRKSLEEPDDTKASKPGKKAKTEAPARKYNLRSQGKAKSSSPPQSPPPPPPPPQSPIPDPTNDDAASETSQASSSSSSSPTPSPTPSPPPSPPPPTPDSTDDDFPLIRNKLDKLHKKIVQLSRDVLLPDPTDVGKTNVYPSSNLLSIYRASLTEEWRAALETMIVKDLPNDLNFLQCLIWTMLKMKIFDVPLPWQSCTVRAENEFMDAAFLDHRREDSTATWTEICRSAMLSQLKDAAFTTSTIRPEALGIAHVIFHCLIEHVDVTNASHLVNGWKRVFSQGLRGICESAVKLRGILAAHNDELRLEMWQYKGIEHAANFISIPNWQSGSILAYTIKPGLLLVGKDRDTFKTKGIVAIMPPSPEPEEEQLIASDASDADGAEDEEDAARNREDDSIIGKQLEILQNGSSNDVNDGFTMLLHHMESPEDEQENRTVTTPPPPATEGQQPNNDAEEQQPDTDHGASEADDEKPKEEDVSDNDEDEEESLEESDSSVNEQQSTKPKKLDRVAREATLTDSDSESRSASEYDSEPHHAGLQQLLHTANSADEDEEASIDNSADEEEEEEEEEDTINAEQQQPQADDSADEDEEEIEDEVEIKQEEEETITDEQQPQETNNVARSDSDNSDGDNTGCHKRQNAREKRGLNGPMKRSGMKNPEKSSWRAIRDAAARRAGKNA